MQAQPPLQQQMVVQAQVVGVQMNPGQQVMHPTCPPGYVPGDEKILEKYEPLQDKKWEVTNQWNSCMQLIFCPCNGWHREWVIMTDRYVIYKRKDLCGTKRTRLPYAAIGYIEKVQRPCGCSKFASDLTGENPMAKKPEEIPGIEPGFCGEESIVDDLIANIRTRKDMRGGVAQMRKLDRMVEKLGKITVQLSQYLRASGIEFTPVPRPDTQREVFGHESFDVTNCCEGLCCNSKHLRLEPEEAVLHIENPCGCVSRDIRREYNDMDTVEKEKTCFCCSQFKTALGGGMPISPGVCCANRAKVSMIAAKLRERLATRGQTGQMRRQEKMLKLAAHIEELMKAALTGTPSASTLYPPTAEVMLPRMGGDAKGDMNKATKLVAETLPGLKPIDIAGLTKTFPDETMDVTDNCESCCACFFTCGCAGWGKERLDLKENDMWIHQDDKMGDSNAKIPYGELDSVEIQKDCCCCWSVNEFSPGWCGIGGRDRVEKIKEALELRKNVRGQIAQMEHLRAAQVSTLAIDLQLEACVTARSVKFPPEMSTLKELYTGQPMPRIITNGKPPIDLDLPVFNPDMFPNSQYVVTNNLETCCCTLCPCTPCLSRNLTFDKREMVQDGKHGCGFSRQRTPYASLGGIDVDQQCCCCHEIGDVANPGWGCGNEAQVKKIFDDLYPRMIKLGSIAQVMAQEQIINDILSIELKLDLLNQSMGIPYPPPEQEVDSLFKQA